MQTSTVAQRQADRAQRRQRLRRQRLTVLAIVAAVVALAIWAAYAFSGSTPAAVPENAAAPVPVVSNAPAEKIVVARLDNIDLLLPVPSSDTTAIAFSSVDNREALAFEPHGERISGGGLPEVLASVFARGGDVKYYLGPESGASAPTAGLSVGAVPGAPIVSPIDGKVVAIKKYRVLGEHPDIEVDIQFGSDPSLLLVMTHVDKTVVPIGGTVTRGKTRVGQVRGFPSSLDQSLKRYTTDNGDHVQLTVVRIKPDPENF